jgi:hypothetical protein
MSGGTPKAFHQRFTVRGCNCISFARSLSVRSGIEGFRSEFGPGKKELRPADRAPVNLVIERHAEKFQGDDLRLARDFRGPSTVATRVQAFGAFHWIAFLISANFSAASAWETNRWPRWPAMCRTQSMELL